MFIFTCHSSSLLRIFSLDVTVQYEQEQYSVQEEDGSVSLALVLDRAVPFNVTVIVSTMDLVNSSVGDAATGELWEFGLKLRTYVCRTSIIRITACMYVGIRTYIVYIKVRLV